MENQKRPTFNGQLKYFLAFTFNGEPDVRKFHVTMLHFGILNADDADFIFRLTNLVMTYLPHNSFGAKFDCPEMFGFKKNIPVLLPPENYDMSNFLPKVYAAIAPFLNSSYYEYNPHVSGFEPGVVVEGLIDRLVLYRGSYEEVYAWELGNHFDIENQTEQEEECCEVCGEVQCLCEPDVVIKTRAKIGVESLPITVKVNV